METKFLRTVSLVQFSIYIFKDNLWLWSLPLELKKSYERTYAFKLLIYFSSKPCFWWIFIYTGLECLVRELCSILQINTIQNFWHYVVPMRIKSRWWEFQLAIIFGIAKSATNTFRSLSLHFFLMKYANININIVYKSITLLFFYLYCLLLNAKINKIINR